MTTNIAPYIDPVPTVLIFSVKLPLVGSNFCTHIIVFTIYQPKTRKRSFSNCCFSIGFVKISACCSAVVIC